LRILTDCGTEYCGKAEQHDYQVRPSKFKILNKF
jgi:hypothetical protein